MRLIQVALHAEDLDRAADFYTVLLESPPTARFDPPGLLFFDLDGVRLLLDRGAPASLLYLHVGNVHETLERLDGLADVVGSLREATITGRRGWRSRSPTWPGRLRCLSWRRPTPTGGG